MLLFAAHSRRSRRRFRLRERAWSALTWPFRTAERAEKALGHALQRKRERFRHKYRHSKVFAPLAESAVWLLLAPLRLVRFALSIPLRAIAGAASRLRTARRKRTLVHLLQGLPAALAAIGVFSVLMLLTLKADDLPQTYRQEAQRAYDAGNFERAQLYLQRVLQLGADTRESSYLLARTLQKTGDADRSAAILDSLAPEDQEGYPLAHLWKAAYLLENPKTFESEEQLRSLHRHLLVAESNLRGDPDLHYYLGRFYFAVGDKPRALEHLKRAGATRPDLNFELYALNKELGNIEAAQERIALARPYLEQKLERQPSDETSRVRLAQMLADVGDYDRMFAVLQEGVSLNPDGPLKRVLARGLVLRYLSQTQAESANPAFGLSLLEEALRLDPHSAAAWQALLQFGEGADASAAAAGAAREMLESLIAVGEAAPLAHFALGLKAWHAEDSENALWHLERAYKLDPSLANLANNLAWMLAHNEDSADYERALIVINSVLEEHPDVPAYIETRGQIYVRLKRWEEALDDLERALPAYAQNIELHESLAKVYRHLGRGSLASKHERIEANLRARQSGEDRK